MAYPDAFLDRVRDLASLSGIVGRVVKLTKEGSEHKGCCPFHTEKTPSFTVSDDKGFYHCFGCGAHGDVIEFVMQSRHLSFPEAVELLAGELGLEVPSESPEARAKAKRVASLHEVCEMAAAWYEGQLCKADVGAEPKAYFLGRGLAEETIRQYRLGWAPGGNALLSHMRRQGVPDQLLLDAGLLYRNDRGLGDMMRERVIFPITDRRGRVVAFGGRVIGGGDKGPKYLNSPATAIFDKGATLYGLAQARQAMGEQGRVVVVEGYMDVLAAHQAGIAEVVAPLGTAFTPEQAALLWGMVPRLVLGMDGDRAGLAAARRAVDRLMGEVSPDKALFFAEFPNGKDPADLIFDGQIEAVVKVLDEARSLADLVWQIEAEGADATTPERVAAWEARLLARCGTIKDHATRRAYLAAFRRRFSAGLWGNVSVLRGAAKTRFAPAPGGGRVWEMWERAGERGRADKVRVWLESRAVDCEALDRVLGGIGVAQGKMIKGRVPLGEGWASAAPLSLWEERDDGAGFIVVPVWAEGRDGALIDLIAWDPRSDAVGSYTGACGVLGQDLVDEARAYEVLGIPHQLKVAAGPLSWLRREGRGERAVLVIDWRTAWETLGCLHTLVAEDLETGERLARACRPPKLRTPAIMVEDRP